jgi:acyl carrier protein
LDDADALLATVERVYAEVRGVRRDLRPADGLRDDLGLDSLAAAELLTALEEELGLSLIDDERVPGARTVGDVLAILATPPRA